MSANTLTPYFDDDNHVPAITWADGQHKRRKAQSALATSVIASLERSGKWAQWQEVEPRLGSPASRRFARRGVAGTSAATKSWPG